jgi:Protein kinase domain
MPGAKLSRWVSRLKRKFKQWPRRFQFNSDGTQQQPLNPTTRNLPKDLGSDPSDLLPTIQSSLPDGGNSDQVSNDPPPGGRTSTDTTKRAATRLIPGPSAENPHSIRTSGSQVSPDADFRIIPIYDGKEHSKPHKCKLPWMDPRGFAEVNNVALRLVREHHDVSEDEQLYRKSGRCRLINNETDEVEESRIVENERQWAEAIPQMVMEHVCKPNYDKFHLEIRWEYSALSIRAVNGEKYATTVQTVVHKKLVTNWEDEKYIPCRDLDEIYQESTIKTLVQGDESIERLLLSADETNEFLEQINLHATRLLAICIHVDMPLACLYQLVKGNYKDEKLPLSRKQKHCPCEEYDFKFENFMKWQGAFVAHKFVSDEGGPKLLADDVVLPITYDKTEPSLGQGGFGEVKKVYIHSDHHYFSSDRDAPLALKIFFRQPRTQEDFGKEEQALRALAEFPHPNITLHLAAWTQKGVFYMLFPCAEMNLHQFLRLPPCDITTDFVKWVMWQLRGLADGVRHIHNLGPSRLVVGTHNLSTPGPQAQRKKSGYHHDIKPKNILVFAKDKAGGGKPKMTDFVFKLSDFGAAKINTMLSRSGDMSYQTDALIVGDPVYRAPDKEIVGFTSRPYDIWSLGCVFLEVLVWIFDLGVNESVISFELERLQSASKLPNQSGAFWHRNDRGKIVLKSSVVKHLQQLRTCGENHKIFKRLVRSIGKMLIIRPSERVTAAEVFNVLDAAHLQAAFDVREQPDIYQRNMVGYQQVAESPTTFFDEGSRQPSIDQRSIGSFLDRENEESRSHQIVSQISSSSDHELRNGITSSEQVLGTTNSDPLQLSPLHTQNLPPRHNHSRSPSLISVSHHDYPEAVEQCLFDAAHDFPEPHPPVGSHMDPVGREDFPGVGARRRTRTGESQSI